MKKKIFGSLIVIAIAAVAAFNVNMNPVQESNMSPLALANVEALAQSETNNNPYCHNGGVGATSCAISSGITIVILGGVTKGCTVTCITGYYACCSIRCTCVSNS
ncbi:NVEALA domain-containing protein [Dysgonomonas reticulitermitis]